MSRFSKATVIQHLKKQADEIRDRRQYDPRKGYDQIDAKKANFDEAVDYGRWRALMDLIDKMQYGSDW